MLWVRLMHGNDQMEREGRRKGCRCIALSCSLFVLQSLSMFLPPSKRGEAHSQSLEKCRVQSAMPEVSECLSCAYLP